MKRGPPIVLVLILTAITIFLYATRRHPSHRASVQSINPSRVLKLRFEIDVDPVNSRIVSAETASHDHIQSLLQVLRERTETEPHACVAVGRLTFDLAGGNAITLEILPGHDDKFLEYRDVRGHYYRINRSAFAAAISQVGIPPDTLK